MGGIYLTFNSVLIKLVLWVTEETVQTHRSGHAPEGTGISDVEGTERILLKLDKESVVQLRVSSPVPKPKYD